MIFCLGMRGSRASATTTSRRSTCFTVSAATVGLGCDCCRSDGRPLLRTDPQEVTEHIGPTSIVAHSQYWTFDHDENQDNICIEMLDYNFVREKMGENPDLEERDRRFDAAVAGTGWPLVKQVKVCVPAGSVILVSAQQSSLLRRLPKSV